MKKNKLNIGLIIGGKSVEHDISILSGLQVYHALDKDKYNVTIFYITKEQEWLVGEPLSDIHTYINEEFSKCTPVIVFGENHNIFYKGLFSKPKATPIDIFVLVLHGDGTEDGTIAGYLDTIGATYTSASHTESAILQDKIYTKQILQCNGIESIPYIEMNSEKTFEEVKKEVEEKLKYPVIIKPVRLGSSIGINCANDNAQLKKGIEECLKYGNRIIIEKKLTSFKEYNLALIKDTNRIISSSIEEVIPTSEILSFKDKYESMDKMSEASNRIIPAILDATLEKEIRRLGIKAYKTFNLKGVVRIDFLYDCLEKYIYINEINTIPGSLAFYLFEKENITFTSLLDILIKNAIISKNQESRYVKSFITSVLTKKGTKLIK
ncbi:MAG: D-alanine--D-alanine ligase [Bacilli bacterium]|nr:D-alanine--D-alanine ligase [Bacilli bacterium]MDD7314397.1 D-alanine--D-alanine ligase [Bacilli bacterium]MDY4053124.1 D-alanine--D-alanine ligase [Bacilli bacterium]